MRFFPVILAILVSVALYFVVIDRDALARATGSEEVEAVAEAPDATPEDDRIKVVARRSVSTVIDSAVFLRGQTEAARQVDVRAETSSTVVSEPLRKGTFVEAGDILCELDPGTRPASLAETRARLTEATANRAEAESRVPEAEARVIEADAMLAEAMVNENAAARLSQDGFASETRVKNAQAAVASSKAAVQSAKAGLAAASAGIDAADAAIESAAAAVAAAQKEIERLTIKAPFSGLLESDTAELGSLLQPGSLCGTVLQLDPIKLVAFVAETEVSRIEVGASAGARLAVGGQELVGNVSFLSRSADENTRTFRVEVEVPNPDRRVGDGQTVEILIASDGAAAHLLPASALTLNDDGALGLRLLDDEDTVRFQPVSLMRDTVDGVWLTGLPDTVDVIVLGQEYVTDGVKVAVTFEEPTQ